MDFFVSLIIGMVLSFLYILYKLNNRTVIDFISVSHLENSSKLMYFIDKYNIDDKVNFVIKGSKCLNYVDKWTNCAVKGDLRKDYFNDPDFFNRFLDDTFGFNFYIIKCQYGTGKWYEYMSDYISLNKIINFDNQHFLLKDLKKYIEKYDRETIYVSNSIRKIKKLDSIKYYKIIKMFKESSNKYNVLTDKDEAMYTSYHILSQIYNPSGRYIFIDIKSEYTQIMVMDC
jgi:hypothetical protein